MCCSAFLFLGRVIGTPELARFLANADLGNTPFRRDPHSPHFFPLTKDVRKYATERGITEEAAVRQGLEQKATEFNEASAEIHSKA
jgi:hypothetical protein